MIKAGSRVKLVGGRDGRIYAVINDPVVGEDGRAYAPIRRLHGKVPMLTGLTTYQRVDQLQLVGQEGTGR